MKNTMAKRTELARTGYAWARANPGFAASAIEGFGPDKWGGAIAEALGRCHAAKPGYFHDSTLIRGCELVLSGAGWMLSEEFLSKGLWAAQRSFGEDYPKGFQWALSGLALALAAARSSVDLDAARVQFVAVASSRYDFPSRQRAALRNMLFDHHDDCFPGGLDVAGAASLVEGFEISLATGPATASKKSPGL